MPRPTAADDLAAVLAEMDADLAARRREPVPTQMPAIRARWGASRCRTRSRTTWTCSGAWRAAAWSWTDRGGLRLLGQGARGCAEAMAGLPREYEQARAQGIAKAAGVLAQLVEAGDLEAVKFLLKAKGGFNAPRDPAGPGVVINLGSLPATVTTINADRLAEEQRAILEAPDDQPAAQGLGV